MGPIGVAGASDEYGAYADRAYVMLMDDAATADAIAWYLFDVATDRMGLPAAAELRQRCYRAAIMLAAVRSEFISH